MILNQLYKMTPPVHEGNEVDAEGRLERRHFVELVENHFLGCAAPQLDDDSHPLAVRLVAQVADAVDLSVPDQLGDALEQHRLVDHVGDFSDHDSRSALRRGAR